MWKEFDEYLQKKINERKEKNAFRQFSLNVNLIDFCSNDYLGFARCMEMSDEIQRVYKSYRGNVNGATGARTITGTSTVLLELETLLANFHLAEAALVYNSGYTANLGFFSCLPYRGDTVLYDELIHASIRDGLQLSKANAYAFKHNDLNSLEHRLSKATGKIFVVVEAVYSMDGDFAPLIQLVKLCNKYKAALVVDEAHSNGIFGENGEGLVVSLGLQNQVFARIMTFGKALGSHGAAIIGNQLLKDFLINYSRPFIFTTAPSPHQVLTIITAYQYLSKENHNILYLNSLIRLFKAKIQVFRQINLIESDSPIQCIIISGNSEVKGICKAIQADGFDVRPIVAPTVPEGKERIRICLHIFNTPQDVENLAQSLINNIIND